jgi:hypothetical protein
LRKFNPSEKMKTHMADASLVNVTPREEALERGEKIYHSREYMRTLADAMTHPATSKLFDYMESWDDVQAVVMHTKTWKQIEKHADGARDSQHTGQHDHDGGVARKMMVLAIMDSMLHDRVWRAKMTKCMVDFMSGKTPDVPLIEDVPHHVIKDVPHHVIKDVPHHVIKDVVHHVIENGHSTT